MSELSQDYGYPEPINSPQAIETFNSPQFQVMPVKLQVIKDEDNFEGEEDPVILIKISDQFKLDSDNPEHNLQRNTDHFGNDTVASTNNKAASNYLQMTNNPSYQHQIKGYKSPSGIWIGKIAQRHEEVDSIDHKHDSELTFKESQLTENILKHKFGQFWDIQNRIKIQGNFLNDKLDGLALVIKEDSSGHNEAEFGFFVDGKKLEDVDDDESMYVYDMLYSEFKAACNAAGIEYFKWIENESALGESELQLMLSRSNMEKKEIENLHKPSLISEEIDIQDLSDQEVILKSPKNATMIESGQNSLEESSIAPKPHTEQNSNTLLESEVIECKNDKEISSYIQNIKKSNGYLASGIQEEFEDSDAESSSVPINHPEKKGSIDVSSSKQSPFDQKDAQPSKVTTGDHPQNTSAKKSQLHESLTKLRSDFPQ